ELLAWDEGEEVSARVLAKMAYRAEPEGVLAIAEIPERALPSDSTLLLVAVGIEKPGNLGAMARTADAAGADALLVGDANADPWNPNAIRASTGAVFTLPIVEVTKEEAADLNANKVAAVLGAATSHTARDYTQPTAFLVGAEDEGLDEEWRALADEHVTIPMRGTAAGALNKIRSLTEEEKRRGVIAISAGNHAQAAAFAAAAEGIDALVVMWQGASEQKIAATRGYGAHVDLEATGPGDAFDRLHELIEQTGRTLVHPFDDPLVIAGAGTVGLEIEEDAAHAGAIVVPVGGGGLISGIQTAIGHRMRVIAVEPETSTALHTGLDPGAPTHVTPASIADSHTAPFAGALA